MAVEEALSPSIAKQTCRSLFAGFVGGLLFSVGSACFVASSYLADWLPSFQAGCGVWIVGCLPYIHLALLDIHLEHPPPRVLSATLQVGGLGCYIGGCVLGFLDPVPLAEINILFAAGSAALTLDVVIAEVLRPKAERCGRASNVQLVACIFFCLAAGFGGYSTVTEVIQFGMFCWLIGSMMLLALASDDWLKECRRSRRVRAKVRGAGAATKLALKLGASSKVAPKPSTGEQ